MNALKVNSATTAVLETSTPGFLMSVTTSVNQQPTTSVGSAPSKSQKRHKTSSAHQFYIELPDLTRRCQFCSKLMAARSSTDSLLKHIINQHPNTYRAAQQKESKKETVAVPECFKHDHVDTLPKAKAAAINSQLTRFFVATSAPFSIVEEPEFRSFVTMLNPGYRLISRTTVKTRIINRHMAMKRKIISILASSLGRISIATDCWTSSARESYMPVTAHWIAPGFYCCLLRTLTNNKKIIRTLLCSSRMPVILHCSRTAFVRQRRNSAEK